MNRRRKHLANPVVALMAAFVMALPGIAVMAGSAGASGAAGVSGAAAVSVRHFQVPRHHGQAGSPDQAPPKVVVLGDSTALTLGYALQATAPVGTTVINGGIFGCGLAIAAQASADPPQPGISLFPGCESSEPASQQWPARDATLVRSTGRGDLVLFLAGDWETQDLLRDGRWTSILQPSFQRYELQQMRTAVAVGTAHGAHFDFLTMPAMANGGFDSHYSSSPTNSPTRRRIYNQLLARVAAEHPRDVSLIDYGSILSPDGRFHEYLHGVQVRAPDGIHTPAYAPGNPFSNNATPQVADIFYNWISPRLWPLLLRSRS